MDHVPVGRAAFLMSGLGSMDQQVAVLMNGAALNGQVFTPWGRDGGHQDPATHP